MWVYFRVSLSIPSVRSTTQQRINNMSSSQDTNISAKLIRALTNDNFPLFCKILQGSEDTISIDVDVPEYSFSTPFYITIECGKLDFARELLRDARVDVNRPHRRLKKYPIHLASESGRKDLVELLVNAGADVNAKMENGSTALHIAAARSEFKNVIEVLGFLLALPNTSINYENNIGVSPIELAISKGSEAAVKLFIDAAASISKKTDDGGTLEELLAEKMPALYENIDLAKNRESPERCTEERLFDILYSYHHPHGLQKSSTECIHHLVDEFIQQWNEAEQNNNKKLNGNYDNGSYTFLQYACDLGMHEIVTFLFGKGVDPNRCSTNYKYPPLIIAAHHGYHKIIETFKNNAICNSSNASFTVRDGVRCDTALHELVKAESRAYANYEHRDYDRCLSLILDDNTIESKLAIIYPMIDAQDNRGNTPLHLAGRLGNEKAVLKILRAGANIGVKNSNGETPIDRIPSKTLHSYLDECIHCEGLLVDEDFKLVFSYNFLGPPMSSMIPSEANIACGSALIPSWQNSGNHDYLPEAEPLWYISQSKRHREILNHPVISSFLCLKWRKIRPYYWSYVIFYLTFVITVTTYIILKSTKDKGLQGKVKQEVEKGSANTTLLGFFIVFFILLLASKELFKALLSFRRYIFSIGNYSKILLISMLIALLSIDPKLMRNTSTDWPLGGSALLLCWLEMAFLLGRHPKVSTYIIMFKTVSKNFFLFLLIFLIPIMAFGLSFFVLLPPENNYFSTPSKSMLKTVVMSLTGEIEFESIDFGSGTAYFFAIGLFVFFVFFIMLVLVNLLNGLAVSDIGLIQKRSETVALTSRVELVSYIESILLGDPFKLLTNWPSFHFLRKLPPCGCFSKIYSTKLVKQMFFRIMGNILLFHSGHSNKKAVFFPNKTFFTVEETSKSTATLLLDKSILRSAMSLVSEKEATSDILELEKTIKLVAKQQKQLIEFMHAKL